MAISRTPLDLSRGFLWTAGVRTFVHYSDRVPRNGALVVASNHRSFMDAFALMDAIDRPVRFACHHYMGQVPLMRDLVERLGCFPLDEPDRRQQSFLRQGMELLQQGEAVGVFPEGAMPMVTPTRRDRAGEFHRGFAHLALKAAELDVAVLPIAIVSDKETTYDSVPVRWLSLFDPTEPLFDREGWHPMVLYRRLTVRIGRPYWITVSDRRDYRGKNAREAVDRLVDRTRKEIIALL